MNQQEFMNEMMLVKNCFPAGMTEAKMGVIYGRVKDLSHETFHKVCMKVIDTSKHAPSVAEILEVARSFRDQGYRENTYRKLESCTLCEGGYINALKRDANENPYAFSCNCQSGEKVTGLPKWRNEFSRTFRVMNESYWRSTMPTFSNPKSMADVIDIAKGKQ